MNLSILQIMKYNQASIKELKTKSGSITSFVNINENNVDWVTVDSFGEEWKKFNSFADDDLKTYGDDYFDIVDSKIINKESVVLDVGCGSGRWSKYLANKVKSIEAIDPSFSVITANAYLNDCPNVRITHASVDNIPFESENFDFVFSLGVLHHLPDTESAIFKCVEKIKKNGYLLLYLYYKLDNRGFLYKLLFYCSNVFRKIISSLPISIRKPICEVIALLVYVPFVLLCKMLRIIKIPASVISKIPLNYYERASLKIIRNDAYDRFGTPLEKRFSKVEIKTMLENAGMSNIIFSPKAPFWHVVAQKM